jgi:hypothetical protein
LAFSRRSNFLVVGVDRLDSGFLEAQVSTKSKQTVAEAKVSRRRVEVFMGVPPGEDWGCVPLAGVVERTGG